ncbi:hypothetical protein FN846DRAFT_643787 [Sphaerosporella brunnea]|uniref:Uncharacterized protein n=1 Tax=Sphaerosporella brunnea TaxID=1250544 RepID=A0A5J5F0E5_9PEZI|nr:hypothetical protein FN846DRAFT_643787 [Sphaerosporella brunnea]
MHCQRHHCFALRQLETHVKSIAHVSFGYPSIASLFVMLFRSRSEFGIDLDVNPHHNGTRPSSVELRDATSIESPGQFALATFIFFGGTVPRTHDITLTCCHLGAGVYPCRRSSAGTTRQPCDKINLKHDLPRPKMGNSSMTLKMPLCKVPLFL